MLSSKCNLSPGFALNRDPSGGVFGHTAGDQVPGASHGVEQVHPVLSTDNRFRGTRGNDSKGVTPHRGGGHRPLIKSWEIKIFAVRWLKKREGC